MKNVFSDFWKPAILIAISVAFMAFDYSYQSYVICGGPCQNGGLKLEDGRCYCYAGFSGACCEIIDPCPNCSFHGQKDGNRCVCDLGWGGDCCDERWLDKVPRGCEIEMTLSAEAVGKLKRVATVTAAGGGVFKVKGNLAYDCVQRSGGGLISCSDKDCSTAIREIIN